MQIDESSSSEGSQGMNVDAPAGLSFQYLKPVNGNHGYSMDISTSRSKRLHESHSDVYVCLCIGSNIRTDGHNRCKAERVYKNQSRHARHALIEPLTVYCNLYFEFMSTVCKSFCSKFQMRETCVVRFQLIILRQLQFCSTLASAPMRLTSSKELRCT